MDSAAAWAVTKSGLPKLGLPKVGALQCLFLACLKLILKTKKKIFSWLLASFRYGDDDFGCHNLPILCLYCCEKNPRFGILD